MTEEIKFLKLRNGEDLVAKVTADGDTLVLKRPVAIMIENIYEEGRQLLNVREWLPPTVVLSDTATIPSCEVIATLEINPEFVEQYEEICEMFFDNKPVIKKKTKAKSLSSDDKVVSILEALTGMNEKKDKPIH